MVCMSEREGNKHTDYRGIVSTENMKRNEKWSRKWKVCDEYS